MSQTTLPNPDIISREPEAQKSRPRGRAKQRGGLPWRSSSWPPWPLCGAGDRIWRGNATQAAPLPPPPRVTVSSPLRDTVATTTILLGQFSAVDAVELRAQVGGILTAITLPGWPDRPQGRPAVRDRPASVPDQAAIRRSRSCRPLRRERRCRQVQLWRAQQLKQTEFGTAETVDQRAADQHSAQAAIETAKARHPGRPARSRVLAASTRRSPAASARIWFRSAASSAAAAAAPAPIDAAGDDRLARPDLSRLRHERGGLPRLSAGARRRARGATTPTSVAISLDGDGRLRPPRHARFHRQCGRSQQRHDPCPRDGRRTPTSPSRPGSSPDCAFRSGAPRRPCCCRPPPSCPISRARW